MQHFEAYILHYWGFERTGVSSMAGEGKGEPQVWIPKIVNSNRTSRKTSTSSSVSHYEYDKFLFVLEAQSFHATPWGKPQSHSCGWPFFYWKGTHSTVSYPIGW